MDTSNEVLQFIGSLSDNRKSDLETLRLLVHQEYPKIDEIPEINILDFKLDGVSMFVFGSQKQHMCFYFSKALMQKHKGELKGLNLGKGTIRFTDIKKINKKVLKRIIKEAAEFPFEYSKRGDSTR
ncbi:MAG: DUF1801 domain-containing protein [Candidatus Heimdallarchaeota archaeon]|nr:DUF1801 domain-containing protein [Candidatus Heimdallarchaeota archaeon]